MQFLTMASNCMNDDRYHVEYLPVEAIKPSPENDKIYGKIDGRDEMFLA